MLYEEVLVDIEQAKNANLPDRLIPKLEKRRNDSLKLMSTVERMKLIEPTLDYEADKNFPCMVNVVEIKYNAEFGRNLVAKCDIPVGKTVVLERDIPQIRDDLLTCNTCLRLYTNCFACPNCADATFCSLNCLNRNRIHKSECGTFFPHLDLEMRFQIKMLLMAIDSFPDVDSLMQFVEHALLKDPETLPTSLDDPNSKYYFFFKLATSAPYIFGPSEAYKVYKAAMNLPKVSGLFDSDRKKRFLMHLVMHHTLISNANSFGVENGTFVANVTSLLNHSCAPNIIGYLFSSYSLNVTGRPIEKGEQLFIKYSGIDGLSTTMRKSSLKSRWGFDCKCERCEPTRAPIDRKLITADPCYKYVAKNQHIDILYNQTESAIIKKKCVAFLNKYGRSPWSSEIEFVFKVYQHNIATAKLV
ncbi:SET domain-containing protein 3-like [Sitodiplosis mosellana]|uniref:SET domain-containing protein 3-like n=1 Tax=Sitodiplosis mosellana TaxID=263140 RepID=UPI0024445408|nr:SET domain-containing protein 3-like [Sitodiplosis mosellana]